MDIIPLVHCSAMKQSLRFYTETLDFIVVYSDGTEDPSFSVLHRGNGIIHLSSHQGDGLAGNAFSVVVNEIDDLYTSFIKRGLKSTKTGSPVHLGPVNQSWNSREFYVDDPDGNTIRFVQYNLPSSNQTAT